MVGTDGFDDLGEGDVFVVAAGVDFCGRGEDGLGKAVGLAQAGGEGDAADGAGGLVVFPAGAGEVAAGYAFHGEHLGAADEHGAAFELRREAGGRGRDEVVGDEIGKEVEPEKGELGEEAALAGDAGGEDVVEGGEAVGGDEEEIVFGGGVDVADLAAGDER